MEGRETLAELCACTADEPPRAVPLRDARTPSRNAACCACAESDNAFHFRHRGIESSGPFRRQAFTCTAKRKWKKRRSAMCRPGGRERASRAHKGRSTSWPYRPALCMRAGMLAHCTRARVGGGEGMVLRRRHDALQRMRPAHPSWRAPYFPGTPYRHRIPPPALAIPLTLAERSMRIPLWSRHHRARLPPSKQT